MGTHILSRFSQQFTSSPEADTSNAIEVAEEGSSDSDVSAVSSAEDDEDESIAVSRRRGSATLSVFPGIGTDGLATAPVCDVAFHPEDPQVVRRSTSLRHHQMWISQRTLIELNFSISPRKGRLFDVRVFSSFL